MNALKNIWSKQTGFSELYSLHLIVDSAENKYVLTQVEYQSGEVVLKSTREGLNWKELEIPKGVALVLTISGKGIISKEAVQSFSNLGEVIPNIVPDEVYYQYTEDLEHLAIIRRALVHDFIKEFENTFITGVYLSDTHVKSFDELIQPSGDKFTVGDQSLSSQELVPFCSALAFLTNKNGVAYPNTDKLAFLAKRKFQFFGILAIVTLLILLVINTLLFQSYGSEFTSLSASSSNIADAKTKLGKVKSEVDRKKRFLVDEGWNSTYFLTHKADDLGFLVPKNVQLSALILNPLKLKETRKEGHSKFAFGKVKLEGFTKSTTTINGWVKKIKTLEWVEDVEITNYEYHDLTRKGEFVIEVYSKD